MRKKFGVEPAARVPNGAGAQSSRSPICSSFDYRFQNGKIVEHWDNLQEKLARPTIEAIAPRDQWKNDNGRL